MEHYTKNLSEIENKIGEDSTFQDELTKMGKMLFGHKYKGTYARDKVQVLNDSSPYCIINTHNSNQGGEHWVALAKYPGKNKYLFYDSFGRSYKKLMPELKGKGFNTIRDTDRDVEQDVEEFNCGQRCLSFLVVCDEFGMKEGEKI